MIEIREMTNFENEEMLRRVGYGHLACARNDQPYIVPINYVYEKPYVYFYTTLGIKTDIIKENPRVCLQLEEIVDNGNWRSVVVRGNAEKVISSDEKEQIIKLIHPNGPGSTPATGIRWVNNWISENKNIVLRIKPDSVTGRSSDRVKITAAFAQSANRRSSYIY